MTAEAPRYPHDNPFVKEWAEPVEFDPYGEPVRTVTRQGVLVLADEPPRPTASSRFIPERAPASNADLANTETEADRAAEEEIVGTETGKQPPVQGQPAGPDEIVGTPEAPAKNEEALAAREATAEQPTRRRRQPEEGPLPV